MHRVVSSADGNIEIHHWAPRALFKDADMWPVAYLCRECHSRWHQAMKVGKETQEDECADWDWMADLVVDVPECKYCRESMDDCTCDLVDDIYDVSDPGILELYEEDDETCTAIDTGACCTCGCRLTEEERIVGHHMGLCLARWQVEPADQLKEHSDERS
jgi:hypothetical protein